jgi:hypothetical protein
VIGYYGTYAHDDNEIWLNRIRFKQNHSKFGSSTTKDVLFSIRGVKTATSVANLTTKLVALENAYSVEGQTFALKDNSGNNTVHVLQTGLTVNGVKLESFEYLSGTVEVGGSYGSGSEYTLRRTYQIVLSGEILNGSNQYVDYSETLRLVGDGGPKFIMIGALTGPVQAQTVQQFTPYKVIQSGYAVGLLDYPTAPAPIWPAALHGDVKIEEIGTPGQFGQNVNRNFPIRWRYEFESAVALSGGPSFI